MREFEYVTFDLADYAQSPALRYQKLKVDYSHTNQMPEFAFLGRLIAEMEEQYDVEDLKVTDNEEMEFWVRKLAKQMAVDILVSGRTSAEIMEQAVALPDEAFDRTVALCHEMATTLNIRVKEIEGKYKTNGHQVDNVL